MGKQALQQQALWDSLPQKPIDKSVKNFTNWYKKAQQSWQTSALAMHLPLAR